MDKAVSDLWWKNAVVYCLDVETYVDSSGDFRGLRDEIHRIIGFRMQTGVSFFRVDAVPYVIGEAGIWGDARPAAFCCGTCASSWGDVGAMR